MGRNQEMTKQEFIEKIYQHFADTDDFNMYNYNDQEYIFIPLVEVKITFNDDDTFNIYRDFCYPHDCNDEFYNEILSNIEENTKKELEKAFGKIPMVEFECSMCPFDADEVGYFNIHYSNDYVVRFVDACISADNISGKSRNERIFNVIKTNVEKMGFIQYENLSFVSDDKLILLFIGELFDTSFSKLKITTDSFVNVELYKGIKYTFVKSPHGQVFAIKPQLIKQYNDICVKYHLSGNLEYFSDLKRFLYIKGTISTIICFSSYEECMLEEEYKALVKKLGELKIIYPKLLLRDMDFSHLNETEFERLCYEILIRKGFIDVHLVGKTNAPDGGKDLIATEHINTITGQETRKWIWQCKHCRKSLDRKDISEINDLLHENKAQGYGLFCSNSITPSALERLENKRLSLGHNKLVYYGCRELETLLSSDIDIVSKYKLWRTKDERYSIL
jgi:hypothetical protein